ncbi:MAG: amino acid racemase [Proteobacteria bacterium]|nr:amino acid racemase [Pseudomonadota bacterium]
MFGSETTYGNTMNTLGIIGGLSWASTQQYYRLINEEINRVRGRQASAQLLIRSIDFQPVIDAQVRNDWNAAGAFLCEAARDLERGGAKAFLIASNTMHLVYNQVCDAVSIPGLNIFDATAGQITAKGLHKVGLLGTRYTMSLSFFREEYARRGIDVIVPEAKDAARVNAVIFKELIHNQVRPESQKLIWDVMARLRDAGADGVILGCTELELLITEDSVNSNDDPGKLPIFDTTVHHTKVAAEWLLSGCRP